MSTTMVETWAVDLVTVGPIYPMVGSEVVLWIIGMALWILWQLWRIYWRTVAYPATRISPCLHPAAVEIRQP